LSRTSPMMEQYRTVKEQHPDKLLMFQVGDFYEFFFEDARVAAREMEIALTTRDGGSENPIPLAGVPIHAAETYLNKLLGKGYKVVICDQVENAAQAKGLVKRDITRILTPGTITDAQMLEESRNNYLAVVLQSGEDHYYGLAAIDVSTGEFRITEQQGENAWDTINDELRRLEPAELLCSSVRLADIFNNQKKHNGKNLIDVISELPSLEEAKAAMIEQWNSETWDQLQLDRYPMAAAAAAAALTYLQLLQQLPKGVNHFHRLDLYFNNRNMIIDNITSRNLELTQTIRDGGKEGSLLWLIDRCMTAMGRRLLRRWLEQPLFAQELIEERLDAVGELIHMPLQRRDLRKRMQEVFDLERFCGRLSYQRINARDLVALKNALKQISALKVLLSGFKSTKIRLINDKLPAFTELMTLIDSALLDDPPTSLKEGGIFKEGYHEEVDRLKTISREGNNMLLEFEKNEKQRTGIKSLRIGYNRNFGYYIEVTRLNKDLVPPEYHRKQTLVNAERYTTAELHQMEEQITGARDKLASLEYTLFEELRAVVEGYTEQLLGASYELAYIDCLQSLAEIAEKNDYRRPRFTSGRKMTIRQARHPVVEQLAIERFVPNDIVIDQKHYLLIITGPNMAGKSTFIRSAALVAIMAQMGSFVPASEADLPLFDRVFARVGAGDDLSRGHSTFMVEMQETATILKEATVDSLIILDEIGRGTSTYDGMSIARSVLEYLGSKIKAKTMFSTHYHELTKLEGDLSGIKNYTMAVKEKGKQVIFLRQVVPGKADKSYGINVARLAGVPYEVLVRAETILAELELTSSTAAEQQLSLLPMVAEPLSDYSYELAIIDELKEIDLNRITPLEAIQKLYELQKQLLDYEQSGKEEVNRKNEY
jgi:DNA mismatch repair protein MutS